MKKQSPGTSLVAQCLGPSSFTARIQSLVGELRAHKPHSSAEDKQKQIMKALELKNTEGSQDCFLHHILLLRLFAMIFITHENRLCHRMAESGQMWSSFNSMGHINKIRILRARSAVMRP